MVSRERLSVNLPPAPLPLTRHARAAAALLEWSRRTHAAQRRGQARAKDKCTIDTTARQIRPATAADAGAIAAIYNHAVLTSTATFDLEPETVAARAAWLAAPETRLCLVGEAAGRVAGWSSLVRWSARAGYDRTAEASIYVAPEAQRSGLGVALAAAVLEAAPALGLHVVIAQICADNVAGLALAASLGFARVGTLHEVGHKFGRVLDVALCERLV